jgi:hypothetical protein
MADTYPNVFDDDQGPIAIQELQAVAGITESLEKAKAGWVAMSASGRRQTTIAHAVMIGRLPGVKPPELPPLDRTGGFLTFVQEGTRHHLGFLFDNEAGLVFDSTFGQVPVTPEEAKVHNQLLSTAEIKGLDETCEVGQGRIFYQKRHGQGTALTTWTGEEVVVLDRRPKKSATFVRKGRKFRADFSSEDETVFVKRLT